MNDKNVAEKFEAENEIESNLTAPIHLTMLLLPHLKQQQSAAIVNVTSGLAYVPHARMPVYCATKSAICTSVKLAKPMPVPPPSMERQTFIPLRFNG